MEQKRKSGFNDTSVEAMMERYRAELLRYQRATPPGEATLFEQVHSIRARNSSHRPAERAANQELPMMPNEASPGAEMAFSHPQKTISVFPPSAEGESTPPLQNQQDQVDVAPNDREADVKTKVYLTTPPQEALLTPDLRREPSLTDKAPGSVEPVVLAQKSTARETSLPDTPQTALERQSSFWQMRSDRLRVAGALSAMVNAQTPARLMFARGAGAFGQFQPYERCGQLTQACFLQTPGEATPVFVRFSTDLAPGAPDALRAVRGLSVRLFTSQGPCDLIGSSLPVWFLRDVSLLPALRGAMGPNPDTGFHDSARFWRFVCDHPQALHAVLWLYSDTGTPGSYRAINGFCQPLLWRALDGTRRAVRCRWRPRQAPALLSRFEAEELASSDSDALIRELWHMLSQGERLRFELEAQCIAESIFPQLGFDPFDPTLVWPEERFVPISLGLMTLERNPDHYTEVEQTVFSPANVVDGIELPANGVSAAMAIIGADAQRARLGRTEVPDMTFQSVCSECYWPAANDLEQPGHRLRTMEEMERRRLADNLAEELTGIDTATLERVLVLLTNTDLDFGQLVTTALGG
ncbi:MAG: catalase [Oscillospiraceae bacterium]